MNETDFFLALSLKDGTLGSKTEMFKYYNIEAFQYVLGNNLNGDFTYQTLRPCNEEDFKFMADDW